MGGAALALDPHETNDQRGIIHLNHSSAFDGVLGFAPSARPSKEEIKRAYRAGALKYHPDRQHNHEDPEAAAEMFRRVKDAFDVLAA